MAGCGGILLLGGTWMRCGWAGCPDVQALGAFQPGGAPVLLDRHGRAFAELAPVESARVRLASLPPHVPQAFIAVEDRRFRRHRGVDWLRIPGAVLANVRSGRVEEGFSTLTMQLARNVFPERLPGRERTIGRKLLEIRVAHEIENQFDKDEILELYLNNIYFGNGAHGIEAASRHYFGKPAARLTLAEAALLAAMPKAPTSYDPRRHPHRARERRDLVLSLMGRQGLITAQQADVARRTPVRVRPARRARSEAGGFARYFVEEVQRELEEDLGQALYHRPWRIHTTLDVPVQRAAEEELERQLRAVEAGALGRYHGARYAAGSPPPRDAAPYLQGAVVVMEAATGDVLAWIGGRDFHHSRFDRVRAARRQAGSAFKPFVYATAIRSGLPLTHFLRDEPLQLRLDRRRTWAPRNFDGTFEGRLTVRESLVRSKNIPAIRLADMVGIDHVAELAERAGVEPPIPRQPSMPLGTVAVSPLELTSAYAAFARLGQAARPRLVQRVESPEGETVWTSRPETAEVLDAGTAFLVTDVLSEALRRGTGTAVRQAGFDSPAAGKTGTTNDGADAWFVGYTPDVVATVWVGFDEPRPIVSRATGGRLAAPVWARLMLRLYQSRARPAPWTRPEGVVEDWVDPATGLRLQAGCRPVFGAAYRELFLASHAPQQTCPTQGQPQAMAVEMLPLPDFEEFTGEPDLPPLELERTPVPPEARAEDEEETEDEEPVFIPAPSPSPAPTAAPTEPATTPRPASPPPAEGEEPAEPPPAPTPIPSPSAS